MMKFDRPLLALYLGVLIVLLAIILVFSAYSAAQTETPSGCLIYKTGQCPTERSTLTTTSSTVETSTTTTIIDLSFLNTTTTTTSPSVAITQAPRIVPPTISTESLSDRWDLLAQCETGGNWATNTGNGFGGGLQFMHQRSYSTWLSFGGGEFAPHPWQASREEQIVIAERVLSSSGWNAWPGCSRRFGWL